MTITTSATTKTTDTQLTQPGDTALSLGLRIERADWVGEEEVCGEVLGVVVRVGVLRAVVGFCGFGFAVGIVERASVVGGNEGKAVTTGVGVSMGAVGVSEGKSVMNGVIVGVG